MEDSMEFPQEIKKYVKFKNKIKLKKKKKLKNRTTIQSRNPTSRYIPKGNKISISKRYLHSMFIAALFITTKT